ncbi:uncharacterized protein LOC112905708 [Agrilus planipennis]|uniref:Uncharacterized protein LOC112905708 n=1 Tax=Agrilus planipennis TaxID=224129 RepID=A0A7F5REN3_AGRPL|nr:uncharacterized protein LOC112905708 [Agrilus planipennis]
MASTGRAVATTSRAVGGALSQAKGAFSNWWSNLLVSPEIQKGTEATNESINNDLNPTESVKEGENLKNKTCTQDIPNTVSSRLGNGNLIVENENIIMENKNICSYSENKLLVKESLNNSVTERNFENKNKTGLTDSSSEKFIINEKETENKLAEFECKNGENVSHKIGEIHTV